jgi:uncharacterized protein (TIGR00290 family)
MIPAALHWSSGKDAAYAFHKVRREGELDIRTIVTSVNETHGRVAIHGVRQDILARQVQALGMPLVKVPLPYGCTNEVYLERMNAALGKLADDNVRDHIFGDLALADVRAWREDMLAAQNLTAHFPLFGLDTAEIAHEIIAAGIKAYVVTLDPKKLAPDICGAAFDHGFLDGLPQDVDSCGENGEFHTLIWDSPDFAAPVDLRRGETLTRDGFVYTDFMLAQTGPVLGSD